MSSAEPAAATRLDRWAGLGPDELREAVRNACRRRDVDGLWAFTSGWLHLHRPGAPPLSLHTQRSYCRSISLLLNHWTAETLLNPTQVDAAAILDALEKSGAQAATRRAYLSGMRAFYRALQWSGAVESDPFVAFRSASDSPPESTRSKYCLEERESLLKHAGTVDRLLILLLSEAGLSVQECVSLTWRDIDLAGGWLSVQRTSRGNVRYRLSPRLSHALQERFSWTTGSVLGFTSDTRARQRLQQLCKQAGIPYRGVYGLKRRMPAEERPHAHDVYDSDVEGASSRVRHAPTVPGKRVLQTELRRAFRHAEDAHAIGLVLVDAVPRADSDRRPLGRDAILQDITDAIHRAHRPDDFAAIIRGDAGTWRFALITRGVPSQALLIRIAHRYERILHSAFADSDANLACGTALGADHPEDLMLQAEHALSAGMQEKVAGDTDSALTLAVRWIRALISGDFDELESLLAPNAVLREPASCTLLQSATTIAGRTLEMRRRYVDLSGEIIGCFGSDEQASVQVIWTASRARRRVGDAGIASSTVQQLSIPSYFMFRTAGDRIVGITAYMGRTATPKSLGFTFSQADNAG